MVRWSVGGDPRTPLLLTQEVSAGGQVVSRGRPPSPPVAHAGDLSGWSGGQSGETPEPPVAQAENLSGWSGGQSGETPEPPCCSRWECFQAICFPRPPLLQVPVVASMLLPQPSEDAEPHCNWGGSARTRALGRCERFGMSSKFLVVGVFVWFSGYLEPEPSHGAVLGLRQTYPSRFLRSQTSCKTSYFAG